MMACSHGKCMGSVMRPNKVRKYGTSRPKEEVKTQAKDFISQFYSNVKRWVLFSSFIWNHSLLTCVGMSVSLCVCVCVCVLLLCMPKLSNISNIKHNINTTFKILSWIILYYSKQRVFILHFGTE